MANDYAVSYPPGAWFNFWTGEKMAAQPVPPSITTVANAGPDAKFPMPRAIHPALGTLPVFVRAGSVLPFQPLIQNTDETPSGPLELDLYPGPECKGSLYLDDGHTFAYQHGEFLRQSFTCESDENSVRLHFHSREGSYKPWWSSIEVVVYDWPSSRGEAKLAGTTSPLKTSYDARKHALHVVISDATTDSELSLKGRAAH
jgi:alpha-glucosidase